MPTKLVCDFCSTEHIAWCYPADDFAVDSMPGVGSIGGWAACRDCHEFILVRDREGLLDRSYSTFLLRTGLKPVGSVRRDIAALHYKFFRCRTGEPYPAINDPDTQTV